MSDAPPAGPATRGEDSDRDALARVLLAIVWMPIQITASLLFATGGIFLLLVLGIAFSPLIGLYFLIRHLTGSKETPNETPAPDADRAPPLGLVRRFVRPGSGASGGD